MLKIALMGAPVSEDAAVEPQAVGPAAALVPPFGVTPKALRAITLEVLKKGITDQASLEGVTENFRFCSSLNHRAAPELAAHLALVLINHKSDLRAGSNARAGKDEQFDFVRAEIAARPELRRLLGELYELPEDVDINSLRFLDFGTTSLIFSASLRSGGDIAVKLLKPRYWDNDRLVIRTREYKSQYGEARFRTPVVHDSSDHWITMDLVRGQTLQEWLGSNKKLEDADYYRRLLGIFDVLLSVLDELAALKKPLSHLDLNPKNILIEEAEGYQEQVWLIDFGVNYAITDQVGAPGQFAAIFASAGQFVPPEAFTKTQDFDPKGDAYSVGMLLASALVERELTYDSLGQLLIDLWQKSPGLAEFVEELIEHEPELRLIGRPTGPATIFKYMKQRLRNTFEFFIDTELPNAEEEPRLRNIWTLLFGIWVGKVSDVRLFKPARADDTHRTGPGDRYYKSWTAIAYLCHAFIVVGCILLTYIDLLHGAKGELQEWFRSAFTVIFTILPIPFFDMFLDWYGSQHVLPVHVGDVLGNLPGRLVCMSFSAVATRYYTRIFSLVHANTRSDALSLAAEYVMRINSFSYLPPISVAMFIQPHWWPYCVFAGILPVVLNNFVALRMIARANECGQRFYSNTIQKTDEFIKEFGRWWYQMLIYAGCCLVFGFFLVSGALKDEFADALMVIILNTAQIIHVIIGQIGYSTRGAIKRLLDLDRRAYRLSLAGENGEAGR